MREEHRETRAHMAHTDTQSPNGQAGCKDHAAMGHAGMGHRMHDMKPT